MATLEQLEARQRQIKKQIQQKKKAMAADERKARNHALMVAGGLVMQHAPGGDWKRVNWDRLAAWLDRYGYKIEECEAEELPTADAKKRLREWERKQNNPGEEAGADSEIEVVTDAGDDSGYSAIAEDQYQPQRQHSHLTGLGGY